MVDYTKDNFLKGREFDNLDDLNAQAYHWLNHTANTRIHGTTQRIPMEAFKEELEIDFAISEKGLGRFRVNVFHQRGNVAMVLRYITNELPTLDELRAYLEEAGFASFKLPERMEVLESLPRNPLGKVQRFTLQESVST